MFPATKILRKEPQNEGLLENDLYLLTQGADAGQDFGGLPEAGDLIADLIGVFGQG